VLAADQFAGLLEDAGRAFRDEAIEGASRRRVAGDAGGPVRAAAHGSDHEFGHRHRSRLLRVERRPLRGDEGVPLLDGAARAAAGLDDDGVDRPPARGDGLGEAVLVEALAAERDEQHGADIGVRAEPVEHALGIVVREAAREADDVDVLLAKRLRDLARHMVGTLDQVGDDDGVADAFPPVLPEPAAHHVPSPAACAARSSSRW
jgi:hypothetical protein